MCGGRPFYRQRRSIIMLRGLIRPRPSSFSAAAGLLLRAPAVTACCPLSTPRLPLFAPALCGPSPVRHGSRKAGALGVKTKSAIKKRFRVSGGGTIRRLQAGKRHLNLHKSAARIRRLGALPPVRVFCVYVCVFAAILIAPSPPHPPPLITGARVEIKAKGILRRYTKALSLSPLARLR